MGKQRAKTESQNAESQRQGQVTTQQGKRVKRKATQARKATNKNKTKDAKKSRAPGINAGCLGSDQSFKCCQGQST